MSISVNASPNVLLPVIRSLYRQTLRSAAKYSQFSAGQPTHLEMLALFPTMNWAKFDEIKANSLKSMHNNERLQLTDPDSSYQLFQLNSNLLLNTLHESHKLSQPFILDLVRGFYKFPLSKTNLTLEQRISLGFHGYKSLAQRVATLQFAHNSTSNLKTTVTTRTKYTEISVESRLFRVVKSSTASAQQNQFCFAYFIKIKNITEDKTIQLQRRRWKITDLNGKIDLVEGEGVVGRRPILPPKSEYSYSSQAIISTAVGRQEGAYTFDMWDCRSDFHEDRAEEVEINAAWNNASMQQLLHQQQQSKNKQAKEQFEAEVGPFLLDGSYSPQSNIPDY
jgi:ApaG protein